MILRPDRGYGIDWSHIIQFVILVNPTPVVTYSLR